jgi:GNAT superfamily N-acetyltransferase
MTMLNDGSLLRMIEAAEIHALRASEIGAASGDIMARAFGGAAGFINRTQPNTLFNRAVGVGEEEADEVDAIIAWYEAHGVPPRFDVCPPRRSARLTKTLESHGLAPETQMFFTRRLMLGAAGAVRNARAPSAGIDIRRVESEADMRAFIDIQIETWPEDGFQRDARLAQWRAAGVRADISRYLVWGDGRPVATASLSLTTDVGWLSAGAVRPLYRGRGIQTALIAHRMAAAAEAGCTHVASLVSPESGSERNLRRAGFILACDRELWLPPDWTDHPFYRGAG